MRIGISTLLLALLVAAPRAQAAPRAFGIGQIELGGGAALGVPVAQEDADLGPTFHLRGRYGLRPRLAIEASTTLALLADGETPSGGSIEAPSVWTTHFSTVFRAGGLTWAGVLRGGLGFTRIALPGDVASDFHLSWELGTMLEWRIGSVRTEIGPQFVVVDLGDATRKSLEIRASAVIPMF